MTKLIYHIATTLDNFIADSNGDAGDSIFHYEGEHTEDFLVDIQQYDAVLMGRKTYEYGFKFGLKPGEPTGFKGLKHYIFSKTMNFESNHEVELVKGDAVTFIKGLKQTEEGKLWLCGGGQLAGSLLEHKLIDQLVLKVNPVLIGKGKRLFDKVENQWKLKLVDIKQYSTGVFKPTYTIIYSS